jgi:hypothetical protein
MEPEIVEKLGFVHRWNKILEQKRGFSGPSKQCAGMNRH